LFKGDLVKFVANICKGTFANNFVVFPAKFLSHGISVDEMTHGNEHLWITRGNKFIGCDIYPNLRAGDTEKSEVSRSSGPVLIMCQANSQEIFQVPILA
jgi:hypothetical protein